MSQDSRSTTAPAPFNKSTASIILRTCENVEFRAHKEVLSLASPVFEDMFAVPQPSVMAPEDVHAETGLPVISVTETSQTLDTLLRLCYPMDDPVLENVDDACEALEAARKYQMDAIGTKLKMAFAGFVSKSPIRVYAIACTFKLESEAWAAADASMKMRTFDYEPALDKISAGAFYRLLQYRRNSTSSRTRSITSFIFCPRTREQPSPDPSQIPLQSHSFPVFVGWAKRTAPRIPSPPSQTIETRRECSIDGYFPLSFAAESTSTCHIAADIILQSSDNKYFYVHHCILAMASPIFLQMLQDLEANENRSSDSQENCRQYAVPEDSATLLQLLHFCYPSGIEYFLADNLIAVHAVLDAARKYKMGRAERFAKQKWLRLSTDEPLRAYFTAMGNGWETEAREAACHLFFQQDDQYVSEMETVSAGVYHRLLVFRKRCMEARILGLGKSRGPDDRDHWSGVNYGSNSSARDNLYNDYLLALDNKNDLLTHKSEEPQWKTKGQKIIETFLQVEF
ncbi:hypothetical protein BKA93DRAFT_827323 [Sparassis latifolia]